MTVMHILSENGLSLLWDYKFEEFIWEKKGYQEMLKNEL